MALPADCNMNVIMSNADITPMMLKMVDIFPIIFIVLIYTRVKLKEGSLEPASVRWWKYLWLSRV